MAFSVGAIQSKLVLDTKGWKRSIAGVQSDTKKTESRFGKLSKSAGGLGQSLKMGIGAALLGIGVASIKAALDINKSMGQIATLIPGSTKRVQELKEQIQELGPAIGKSTDDLAAGAYQVISAYGDTSETMELLEINARAAAAGMSTTTEAINLTSAVTKGYGVVSAIATQKAADLAFQTVKLGQTTFPELAASMGRTIPLAATLNVKQEELFGTFATLTGVTGNAAEVSTQYAGILGALIKQTPLMTDTIKALRYESAKAMIADLGLVGSLKKLRKEAGQDNITLGKLIRRKEALTAVLALTGAQAKTFTEKLAQMKKAQYAANIAFKAMTTGVNATGHEFEKFKVSISVIAQKVGDALIPILSGLLSVVKPIITVFTTLIGVFNSIPGYIKLAVAAFALMRFSAGYIGFAILAVVKAFEALHESMKEDIRLIKARAKAEGSAMNLMMQFRKVANEQDKAFMARGMERMRKRIEAIRKRSEVEKWSLGQTKKAIAEEISHLGKAHLAVMQGLKLRSAEYRAWLKGVKLVNGKVVDNTSATAKEIIAIDQGVTDRIKELTLDEYQYAVYIAGQKRNLLLKDLDTEKNAEKDTTAAKLAIHRQYNLEIAELNKQKLQDETDTLVASLIAEQEYQEEVDTMLIDQIDRHKEELSSFEEFKNEMLFQRQSIDANDMQRKKIELLKWRNLQKKSILENIKDEEMQTKALAILKKTYYEKLNELRENDGILAGFFRQKWVQETIKMINLLTSTFSQYYQSKLDKEKTEYEEKKAYIIANVEDEDERKKQLTALDEEYAKKEKELKKDKAIADKAAAIFSTIINTAQAISKAWTAGPFLGPVLAGIIAVLGAAQVAMIAAQPIPFEKGGIATSETIARVAEKEPEAIIPLSQLPEILGTEEGGGGINITFHIHSLDPANAKDIVIEQVIPILEEQLADQNFQIPTKAVRG